tara:strand:- start:6927 stop:8396 length:1470 start_codon:yes stop_codon:yes gene_type:complete
MSIIFEKVTNDYFINLYQNNEIYIGNKKNDKREGYGKYFNENTIYNGNWLNNLYNGDGILIYNNIKYDGTFLKNKFIKGIITYPSGYKYNGDFLDNKKHGYGEFYYETILICKGIWDKNTLICNDKEQSIFNNEGELHYIVSSLIINNDKIILPEDSIVSEYVHKNKINNIANHYMKDDYYLVYRGKYKYNMYNGYGELYIKKDSTSNTKYTKIQYCYKGEFKDNSYNGYGELYNIQNTGTLHLLFKGNFKKNKIIDSYIEMNNFSVKPYFKYKGEIYAAPLQNCGGYIFNIRKKKGEYTNFENNYNIKGEWQNNYINNLIINTQLSFSKLYNIVNIINQEYSENVIFQGIKLSISAEYEGTLYSDNLIFEGICRLTNQSLFNYIKGKLYLNNSEKVIISEGQYVNQGLEGIGKKYNNGILESEGYYINNKLDNYNNRTETCKLYHPGKNIVKYSGIFYNGKPHGLCSLFDETSTLIGLFNFIHGEINN